MGFKDAVASAIYQTVTIDMAKRIAEGATFDEAAEAMVAFVSQQEPPVGIPGDEVEDSRAKYIAVLKGAAQAIKEAAEEAGMDPAESITEARANIDRHTLTDSLIDILASGSGTVVAEVQVIDVRRKRSPRPPVDGSDEDFQRYVDDLPGWKDRMFRAFTVGLWSKMVDENGEPVKTIKDAAAEVAAFIDQAGAEAVATGTAQEQATARTAGLHRALDGVVKAYLETDCPCGRAPIEHLRENAEDFAAEYGPKLFTDGFGFIG